MSEKTSVNWGSIVAAIIIAVIMVFWPRPSYAQYLDNYDAAQFTDDGSVEVGDVFTETFTIQAPEGAAEVGIRFGFWNYTQDPELDAEIFEWSVNSQWNRCSNYLDSTGIIQCEAGNIQPGQEVKFTIRMKALQPGNVRTAAYLWRNSPNGETSAGLSHEWQINPEQFSALVSLPELLSVRVGKQYTIPVISTDLTGKGVISYEGTFYVDPTLVQVDKIIPGPLSYPGFDTEELQLGKWKFATRGIVPLFNGGEMFSIVVTIIGDDGMTSPVELQEFVFNGGNPETTIVNGRLDLYGYVLSGKTLHRNGSYISGAYVTLSDGYRIDTRSSNLWGDFSLWTWGSGYNQLTFNKEGALEDSVNAEDAAEIDGCVMHRNPCDVWSMDTDGNGQIQSFDAALVAQYDAGIDNPLSLIGGWRFNELVFNNLYEDQFNLQVFGHPIGDANDSYGQVATTAATFVEDQYTVSMNENRSQISLTISGPRFHAI